MRVDYRCAKETRRTYRLADRRRCARLPIPKTGAAQELLDSGLDRSKGYVQQRRATGHKNQVISPNNRRKCQANGFTEAPPGAVPLDGAPDRFADDKAAADVAPPPRSHLKHQQGAGI